MAATPADIAALRRLIAEPDDTAGYTDTLLSQRLTEATSTRDLAAEIWAEKAAAAADLVDITEAGSSRKNSQAQAAALKMVEFFGGSATSGSSNTTGATTRAIERA